MLGILFFKIHLVNYSVHLKADPHWTRDNKTIYFSFIFTQQSSEKLKKQIKNLEKVKTTKKKHAPKKNGEKNPKVKTSKKSAADQNSAPVPSADKSSDQDPSLNATEAVKEENSQEEGGEQKSEKPKKVKKKV